MNIESTSLDADNCIVKDSKLLIPFMLKHILMQFLADAYVYNGQKKMSHKLKFIHIYGKT